MNSPEWKWKFFESGAYLSDAVKKMTSFLNRNKITEFNFSAHQGKGDYGQPEVILIYRKPRLHKRLK